MNAIKKHFYAVYECYCPNSALTNRMLSYLAAWSKMNVELTVVFIRPDDKFSKMSQSYDNIKIKYMWEVIPIRSFALSYLLQFFYVKSFVRTLVPGDVVYLYSNGYILCNLLKVKGINVYLEKTEHPFASNPGKWPYKLSVKRYLECCRKVKGMFVISNPLKEYFVDEGVDEKSITIINMTVDATRFEGLQKNRDKSNYIAYCGTATNEKDGVNHLIEAFSLLCSKFPDLFLYIIGGSPNKQHGSNVSFADKLGLGSRVVFTGIVPFTEIPQMLKNAAILVLDRPDNLQAKYGFPTKLGEYLLTGNPVVVTDVGDISRFIEDKISGMIAKPNSEKDFAEKIEWLLTHPEEAQQIGERGRQVALTHFNNITEADKILEVLFDEN